MRPKLLNDGMFLVGLDIVGDKLMEVNVFSPGGLGSCQRLYGTNFAVPVITALERKVELRYAVRRVPRQPPSRHALSGCERPRPGRPGRREGMVTSGFRLVQA